MPDTIQRIGELSKDGVFIFNHRDKTFIYANDAFAGIFNLEKEQVLQSPELLLSLIRSEDSYYLKNGLKELYSKNTVSNTELRLQMADGLIRHLSCDAYLLSDNYLIAGFVKDITKEKEHEDYIINYGAKKDTLLDMLSHNLTGPLSLSRDILQWIQRNHKETIPDSISKHFYIIEENTKYCLDIIDDLLKQEHLESEKIYIKKTRFDVLERLLATVDKLIATNKNKKFTLVTQLKNLNVTTDSVKFFQIIHNLVSNAVKFTPENGQIDIVLSETPSTFIIQVKDNGIGIPPHLRPNLFQKRTSSGRHGLQNETSTGLGLYIVKTLVGLLHGKLTFETEENKGSVFTVELPKD